MRTFVIMTLAVALFLEILSVIYLSSKPWKFEYTYSLVLLMFTSMALAILIGLKLFRAEARPSIRD